MSSYDSVNAKFNEVSSNDWTIWNYNTEAEFAKKVDISVAGVIMDCGECHVGGGAMEYVPFSDLDQRIPLRDISTTPVNGGPAIDTNMFTAFNYFIDTYDVDRDENENEVMYMDYAKTGVMEMDCLLCHLPGYDYAERTYLLRQGKIDATRAVAAGFAEANPAAWPSAANTPADGYGTLVTYDDSILVDDYVSGYSGTSYVGYWTIPGSWLGNMAGKPDSTNCAFCHMNKPGVDWKKRGDNWPATVTTKFYNDATDADEEHQFEVPIDGSYEVHTYIGCMGCHERKPTALQPDVENIDWQGSDGYATMGTGLLGHDPAKGSAPFSSLYNGNDYAAFKKCEDCHLASVEESALVDTDGDLIPDSPIKRGEAYGAPNPTAAHAAYGLTAKIVQATSSVDGTPAISHIDLMDCAACHSRKIDTMGWMNTGNPMVDATGSDAAGRMTDHENDYVIKEDMTDRSGLSWYKGKLIRASILNTLFWRDKNDVTLDANLDGRGGGMDALQMTLVNQVNEANGWVSITEDTHGNVTPADINARVTALTAAVSGDGTAGSGTGTWTGDDDAASIKLSMMHVAFKDQHGVSPAMYAWGSGKGNVVFDETTGELFTADDHANPCMDCHDAGANFYNGSINTIGDNVTFTWDDDLVPFTKVNGFSQATDMHPNVKDKFNVRSLASRVATTVYTPLPRAATMYEATFMGKASFADSYLGSTIDLSAASEAGWLFMVEAIATDDIFSGIADDPLTPEDESVLYTAGTTFSRTRSLPSGTNAGTIGELLTALGASFTSGQPEFTISANGTDALRIDANAGYQIRLKGGVDNAASFGLINAAYVATPWTGTDGGTYTGRADWVDYLNGLFVDSGSGAPTPADYGIGVDPVAAIAEIAGDTNFGDGVQVEVGATVDLVADVAVNTSGSFTYSWICNDTADETLPGATASKTFDQAGTWTVTLKVIDEEGNLAMAHQDVVVVTPDLGTSIDLITLPANQVIGDMQTFEFSGMPAEADQLRIQWGDTTYDIVAISSDPQQETHLFQDFAQYIDPVTSEYVFTVGVLVRDLVPVLDVFGNPTGATEAVVLETKTLEVRLAP